MRSLDVVFAFPGLLLLLTLIYFTCAGAVNLVFVLGITSVLKFA
ncbi:MULTISPECIES: hypothetical protein [Burkholderia cepacia complex]|nr:MULTISPECIES: hypothetical protein [Burkholderia cepacia complex]